MGIWKLQTFPQSPQGQGMGNRGGPCPPPQPHQPPQPLRPWRGPGARGPRKALGEPRLPGRTGTLPPGRAGYRKCVPAEGISHPRPARSTRRAWPPVRPRAARGPRKIRMPVLRSRMPIGKTASPQAALLAVRPVVRPVAEGRPTSSPSLVRGDGFPGGPTKSSRTPLKSLFAGEIRISARRGLPGRRPCSRSPRDSLIRKHRCKGIHRRLFQGVSKLPAERSLPGPGERLQCRSMKRLHPSAAPRVLLRASG